MTQSRCWDCNNMFESSGYQTRCSVCTQTKVLKDMMEQQARQSQRRYETPKQSVRQKSQPVIYTRFTEEDKKWFAENYVPPNPEDLQKQRELRKIDKLFSFGVDISLFVAWFILWNITSGWITFFSFIAAIYLPFYLHEQHFYWQIKNSKYLYQI